MSSGSAAIRAGRAFVELFVKDQLLAKGLEAAQKRLKAWGQQVNSMGTKLLAAGTAIAAPVLGAMKLFAASGDQLDKMAQRTGISVEALSQLRYAADQSGLAIETLETGIRKMQVLISDAAQGSREAADTLAGLGLRIEDLKDKSPVEQLMMIADRIARIADPADRAAAAVDLFGRSGTELLPLLAEGAGGMRRLMDRATELGIVMSTEDARAAAELNDRMSELWQMVKALAGTLVSAMMPAIRELVGNLQHIIASASQWISRNADLIVVVTKVGAALVALGAALKAVGAAFALLAINPVVLALTALVAAVTGLCAATNQQIQKLSQLKSAAQQAREAADAQRRQDVAALERLRELAGRQRLLAEEQKEARHLVEQLTKRYGDLGITIDETTGRIEGLTEAMRRQHEVALKKRRLELNHELRETKQNIESLTQAINASKSAWGGIAHFLSPWTPAEDPKLQENLKKREELLEYAAWLQEELKDLNKQFEPEEKPKETAEALQYRSREAVTKAADFESRLAERLHQLRIQQIEDEEERAIAAVQHQYDELRRQAEQLGADVAAVEKNRMEEIAAIHQRFQQQRAAEARRAAEEQAAREEDLVRQLERAQIEAAHRGDEQAKRLALLDMERRHALAEAQSDTERQLIEQLYNVRRQLLEDLDGVAGGVRRITTAGSFSALVARGLAGGPAERTARAAEATARNTKQLVDAARQGGLVFEG